ncbi:outer membrane beta-barrel protein [Bradyrhizobium sp. LHD-71]|uniref:outer membrane beta-barrel protein n=1 Tax=Bradyrhizobium sp. LHD-71 TaxID=3072141 RepID=UPI0028109079|nr:outer membrane beta-barrel protein [Bradyrhizobium sp. LHD-71]MDQ8729774.1 outer membrane beta-barrel protein [Bradyrhizobium sp. LHD-71]
MAIGATRQSRRSGLRSFRRPTALAIIIGSISPAHAQVIPLFGEQVAPPWSSQRVFERTPLPKLEDPDTVEQPEPEDTPVKTRQHPGYEPVGIRSGPWMFNPSLTAGVLYDSNVFSSNTLRRSDIAAMVEPALRLRSMWERHGLDLKLSAQSINYRENSSLDETNYGVRGSGWFDVARDLMVLTSFQASHLNEGVGSLASPANAVEPTPYDLFSGDVTVRKEFNRWALAVGVGVESYNFGSTRAQDGTIISQSARDGQIYALHGRADYAFSSNVGWFSSLEYNQRELRGTATQSIDSHGYRVLTGLNIALTRLITGEFGVGYVQQRFDDPTIGTIEGPAYRAMLNWSPTRMMDVKLKAEQLVTQTSDTSATGVIADSLQLGVDYELRRNVVVSVAGGMEWDRFHGQSRSDQVNTVDSRIKYLPNRFGTISLFHRYTDRNSNVPAFRYEKHLVGFNATAQF